jgi:hypothetical protein
MMTIRLSPHAGEYPSRHVNQHSSTIATLSAVPPHVHGEGLRSAMLLHSQCEGSRLALAPMRQLDSNLSLVSDLKPRLPLSNHQRSSAGAHASFDMLDCEAHHFTMSLAVILSQALCSKQHPYHIIAQYSRSCAVCPTSRRRLL